MPRICTVCASTDLEATNKAILALGLGIVRSKQ